MASHSPQKTDKIAKEPVQDVIEHDYAISPDDYRYYDEEACLAQILQYYDAAMTAYQEGDFGLAETKIDSASVLCANIDLDTIDDESLVTRYQTTLSYLFQGYGKLLNETERIVQENPMAWLDELTETDPEQFKNGKWTDEELKRIVVKIALISDIPLDYNDSVRNSILYFQTNGRSAMTKWLQRSGRYVPIMQEILQEEGLPLDLVYLSMIESGFSPTAYSRASCVGLWQFLYSTGRLYGLNRTTWVDERRDPVKSTRAAAAHLKDLYKMYGDWQLVMAAYNSGPTRVTRQFQAEEGDIEFWEMALPRETKNYVPSFIAATVIAKAPDLFGFENIEKAPPLEYDEVSVRPYTSLSVAAKCAGTDVATIKGLNAELRTDNVPADVKTYSLKVPKGSAEIFRTAYDKVPAEQYTPPRVSTYYVKRGDTLSQIATRYGVSLSRLMAANNIRNANTLRIGQAINIPGTGSGAVTSSSTAPRVVTVDRTNTARYTVKRDDSLWLISQRHNTTVAVLQALNNMGSATRIMPGQVILLPGAAPSTTSTSRANTASPQVASSSTGEITYTIQKNDTLYEIAQKYGVKYQEIMQWNKITNHRTIKPGQRIVIKTKG